MNAIDLLTRQHRHLEHLVDKLLRLPPSEVEGRRAVAARLAEELMLHAEVGERHFYRAAEVEQTLALVEAARQDQLEALRLVSDLVELDPREAAFEDAAQRLRARLESHVEQEEDDLFPIVERLLPAEELEAQGQGMEATLREIQDEQAHRAAADEPVLH